MLKKASFAALAALCLLSLYYYKLHLPNQTLLDLESSVLASGATVWLCRASESCDKVLQSEDRKQLVQLARQESFSALPSQPKVEYVVFIEIRKNGSLTKRFRIAAYEEDRLHLYISPMQGTKERAGRVKVPDSRVWLESVLFSLD